MHRRESVGDVQKRESVCDAHRDARARECDMHSVMYTSCVSHERCFAVYLMSGVYLIGVVMYLGALMYLMSVT